MLTGTKRLDVELINRDLGQEPIFRYSQNDVDSVPCVFKGADHNISDGTMS